MLFLEADPSAAGDLLLKVMLSNRDESFGVFWREGLAFSWGTSISTLLLLSTLKPRCESLACGWMCDMLLGIELLWPYSMTFALCSTVRADLS